MAKTNEELDIEIKELQDASWNNGGYFRFLTIENAEKHEPAHAIKNYVANENEYNRKFVSLATEKFMRLQKEMKKFKLLILDDWEKTTRENLINYFSCTGPCPPESIDQAKLDELREKFMHHLKEYLHENNLTTSYIVDEYNFDGYDLPWGDQMNCDIIFEVDRKVHILHLGFSS